MKKLLFWVYNIISWLIVLLLLIVALLFSLLENPAILMKLAEKPLREQGVEYGEMSGSLLSGFKLKDVKYKNQVKAKSMNLKVDFQKLEERLLYVENLKVEELEIDETFLKSIVDANNSSSEESNGTLPFDSVILNNIDLSIVNTSYQKYQIHRADLHIDNFKSDMKKRHEGDISFQLDSNVADMKMQGKIKDDHYQIEANIQGEQLFLNDFLIDENISFRSNPKVKLSIDGNMEQLKYSVEIERLSLKQNEYLVDTEKFLADGEYFLKKEKLKVAFISSIHSNVAALKLDGDAGLNIKDINNTLKFNMKLHLEPKDKLFVKELREQNLTIESLPYIDLVANGDMHQSKFELHIKDLKAKQNEISLELKDLNLNGDVKPILGDTNLVLSTHFDSSVGSGYIAGDTGLNIKDINNTLTFNMKLHLEPKDRLFVKELREQNLTIASLPYIDLAANGDMHQSKFELHIKELKAKQNEISLHLKALNLNGDVKPILGDTNLVLSTHFDSSVADGTIQGESRFNFNDINNTIAFKLDSHLDLGTKYINSLLKDSNITLSGDTPLALKANGDMNNLKVKLSIHSHLKRDGIDSAIELETDEIELSLKEHTILGRLSLISKAKEIELNLQSNFSGDYEKIEKLTTDTTLNLMHFNAFEVNLETLTPINLKLNNSPNGAVVALQSEKLNLKATSRDYDTITFNLNSEKIYPHKIMKLPKALDKKFVKLNLEGSAQLSKEYFSLKGDVNSNRDFKLNIDAKNSLDGLEAKLFSKFFKLKVEGDLKNNKIHLSANIDSLKKLQKELNSLYDFEIVNVDGEVKLVADLKGEEVAFKLASPKLRLDAFNVEKVDVAGAYRGTLLTLDKLSFNTTGFKQKSLNQHYYLNQKGVVELGERKNILIDMHPKILIEAKGEKENLKARVQVEALPLGHPEYGNTILSCDIDYIQEEKKRKILGGIFLDKLKLLYESKYLDPSYDNDVIVLSKKEKEKKEGRDSFLEDTFIDVLIYAPEAKYKTRDIELEFSVNVKADKKFKKSLRLVGKIEEITGRVEQAPKIFTIVDSNIVFRGAKEPNPLLDIVVEHELPDVLITINIHGNAKRPKITFSSEPPLPKKDILSYLVLGVSTANLSDGKGSLGREAQLFIMNQAARDLAYEVELDRVLIKDDGTGEGYAIQVGKRVNDDSMVIIENSKEGNSFILEYDVNKNIKVEVGHHQKTVPSQSIDILFRKRFK